MCPHNKTINPSPRLHPCWQGTYPRYRWTPCVCARTPAQREWAIQISTLASSFRLVCRRRLEQCLQGMAAHGAQGVDGAGHSFRGVPGAQVLLVVREGLDRQVGRGRGCRRCRLGVRLPGASSIAICSWRLGGREPGIGGGGVSEG